MIYELQNDVALHIPMNYWSILSVNQTIETVNNINAKLVNHLSLSMNLIKIESSEVVPISSDFDEIINISDNEEFVIPKDMSKWNRYTIKKYGISPDSGIIHLSKTKSTKKSDNFHSDIETNICWERLIKKQEFSLLRLEEELFFVINGIYLVSQDIMRNYSILNDNLKNNILCITSQYLENLYPKLTPSQREYKICKKLGMVFIEKIGVVLDSNLVHMRCEPDVDDCNINAYC